MAAGRGRFAGDAFEGTPFAPPLPRELIESIDSEDAEENASDDPAVVSSHPPHPRQARSHRDTQGERWDERDG